jgi:hypothetical protein
MCNYTLLEDIKNNVYELVQPNASVIVTMWMSTAILMRFQMESMRGRQTFSSIFVQGVVSRQSTSTIMLAHDELTTLTPQLKLLERYLHPSCRSEQAVKAVPSSIDLLPIDTC